MQRKERPCAVSVFKHQCHRPLGISGTFAIVVTCFVRLWGTSDYESLYKLERAYGSRFAGLAVGDMAVKSGIGSVFGVPVYDITQGFGYRLPTQGALGQSPLVFLRFVASAELIQTLHLAAALLLCSWAVTSLLGPSGLSRSARSIAVAHAALLGPVFLYTVVNEWTPTAAGYCARVTIIAAVLRLAANLERPWRTLEAMRWSLAVVSAIGLVAVGHPGEWPLVLPAALILSIQACGQVIRAPRSMYRLITVTRHTALLAVGSATALAISVYEIFDEVSRPISGSVRFVENFSLPAENVPNIVRVVGNEHLAAMLVLIVMSVLGPVVDLVMPTNGRYEFAGLTLLIVVMIHLRRHNSRGQCRVARWAIGLVALTMLFWIGEVSSLTPVLARSSGAWLHAPQVFMTGVLAVLGLRDRSSSAVLRGSRFSSGGPLVAGSVLVALIYPVSMLAGTPPSHQNLQEDMAATSLLLLRGVRAEVAQPFQDRPILVARSWVRAFEGFPAMANEPKIRSAATLSVAPALGQVVSAQALLDARYSDTRDFASVAVVLGSQVAGRRLATPGLGETLDHITLPDGTGGVALRRSRFHTFTVERDQLVSGDIRCPLLDDPSCISMVGSLRTNPRAEPRWRLGRGAVLATYEWDAPRAAWAVLLPLDFDPALLVTDVESSEVLQTHSHFGLLAVEIPSNASRGVMKITLRPDARMYARVTATYLHAVGLFVALVSVCRRRLRVAESSIHV